MEVLSISQRSEASLARSHVGNSGPEEDCYSSEEDGRAEDQLSPLPSFYNGSPLRTPLRMQQQLQQQQLHRHGEDY